MDIYQTPILFQQNLSDEQQKKFMDFYKEVFSGYNITTIHDCSIGAGGTTLPLARLGYKVSGSDLSENLLNKARENFKAAGYDADLFISDFRSLDKNTNKTYDCIISTGNSLPHINNSDIEAFVKSMHSMINDDGLLYIDMRNWDMLLEEKPILKAHNPIVMTAEQHICMYLVFNWHDNNSVDFIFATSFDKNGKNDKVDLVYTPTYYPLKYKVYEKILNDNGFKIRKCFDVDNIWKHTDEEKTGDFEKDFSKINWYAILAQKVN